MAIVVRLYPSDDEGTLDEDLKVGTSSSDPDQDEASELSEVFPAILLDLPRKHSPRAVPNA